MRVTITSHRCQRMSGCVGGASSAEKVSWARHVMSTITADSRFR